jgi:hypothetical protein
MKSFCNLLHILSRLPSSETTKQQYRKTRYGEEKKRHLFLYTKYAYTKASGFRWYEYKYNKKK